jgi:hypothetical protein
MYMRNAIKMFGLTSVLALSACGGGNAGGDDLKKFVGTWRSTAGSVIQTCPGYETQTAALTANAIWSTGVSSDLLLTTGLTACPLMADVTRATASGVPGQTCSEVDGAGATATTTFSGYTFVVAIDGHTASENASGNVTYVDQGVSVVCSFSETGSYEKIGN